MKKPDFHAEFIEACIQASGLAYICGYHEAARTISEFVTCDKKALTTAGKATKKMKMMTKSETKARG